MKVCIAGKNNIGADVLRFAVQYLGDTANLLVVCNSDDPGRHTWQRSLRQTARELDVCEVRLEDVYEIEDLLFLSVEYNSIIKPHLFKTKQLVNIHFSHLPKYKGMYTSVWPILNGEQESGVTLHRIDKGIDTGAIIAQNNFIIEPNDTSRDVYFNYLRVGYQIIAENFDKLLTDTYHSTPQSPLGSSYYSRKSIDYSNLKVNFWATAQQVHNYVRGFAFYEYQLPKVFGKSIWKSEITSEPSLGKPGEIVHEDEQILIINTIDYNVQLFKDYSQQLFEAVEQHDIVLIRELATRVADLNITNRQGWSPLMIASYKHQSDTVATLIDAGADVNQHNINGTSVLMYAKDGVLNAGATPALLDYLLGRGADIHHCDQRGHNLLDYCQANGNIELMEYFKGKGVHPNNTLE